MLVRKIQTVVFFLQVRTFLQANLMENPTSTLAGTKGRACYDKHALAIKGATKKRFAFSPAPLSLTAIFFQGRSKYQRAAASLQCNHHPLPVFSRKRALKEAKWWALQYQGKAFVDSGEQAN